MGPQYCSACIQRPVSCLLSRCRRLHSWVGDGSAAPGAPAVLDSIPALLTSRLAAASTVAPLSPLRTGGGSASPCAAGSLCSPTFRHSAACCSSFLGHGHCFSAPASPAAADAAVAAAAAAARAVEAEVRALRSARRAYQRAALGQQELCNSVARTINTALKEDSPPGQRPQSAGSRGIAAGRRKWKRELAAELQGLCGTAAGVD